MATGNAMEDSDNGGGAGAGFALGGGATVGMAADAEVSLVASTLGTSTAFSLCEAATGARLAAETLAGAVDAAPASPVAVAMPVSVI